MGLALLGKFSATRKVLGLRLYLVVLGVAAKAQRCDMTTIGDMDTPQRWSTVLLHGAYHQLYPSTARLQAEDRMPGGSNEPGLAGEDDWNACCRSSEDPETGWGNASTPVG